MDQESQYAGFSNAIVDQACMVIKKVSRKINESIKNLQHNDEAFSKLKLLKDLHFENDVEQKVPTLREYLNVRKTRANENPCRLRLVKDECYRHAFDAPGPPNVDRFAELKSENARGLFLNDFENFVLYKIDFNAFNTVQYGAAELREWFIKYMSVAKKYYSANDQLGLSRSILTQLKIVALLDKIATKAYRLYKEHRCGINPTVFDNLILPQRCDMEIVHQLQKYFEKRNTDTQAQAMLPGLLEHHDIREESFPVRFARGNDAMKATLAAIAHRDERTKEQAFQEYETARQQLSILEGRLQGLECEHQNANGKRIRSCAKCKLQTKINGIKVNRYECSLPSEEVQKQAVCFELLIPLEIACLRDVLAEVVKQLNKEPAKACRIYSKWNGIAQLSALDQSSSQRVFLGSSKRPTGSKYVKPGPFTTANQCFVNSTLNCVYYWTDGEKNNTQLQTQVATQSIEEANTFKVENGSPYESLQWTIAGNHTQNEVLARQNNCPQNLLLAEFNNYGSLRADGYRLQLRKLYTMIATEALSFEAKSVQALIMQTMYVPLFEN